MQHPQRQCNFHSCVSSIRVRGCQRLSQLLLGSLKKKKAQKKKSLITLKIMVMSAEHNKAYKHLGFLPE